MPIHVVNRYKHAPTPNDVYIGRGTPVGNPFTGSKKIETTKAKYQVKDRAEAVKFYEDHLNRLINEDNQPVLDFLGDIIDKGMAGDVYLVCFCAPLACHGDYIKKICDQAIELRKEA